MYTVNGGNLALFRPTNQSDTHGFGTSDRAVDSVKKAAFWDGSCTHTSHQNMDPWWSVTLKYYSRITRVAVTNRGDCCHREFVLSNYY